MLLVDHFVHAMSSSDEVSWVSWFCGLRGNEYFCEVSEKLTLGLKILLFFNTFALFEIFDFIFFQE